MSVKDTNEHSREHVVASVVDWAAAIVDPREQFDSHPLALVIYDWRTLQILDANRCASLHFGYARDELREMSFPSLFRHEDLTAFYACGARIDPKPGNSGSVGEWPVLKKNGLVFHCTLHYQIIGAADNPLCLVSYVDVSELVLARQRAEQSATTLRTVLNSVPQAVYWKDVDSVYVGCNRAFAKEAGLARAEDVTGMRDDALPWRLHTDEIRATDQQALRIPVPLTFTQKATIAPTGEERWYRQIKTALRTDSNDVIGVLTVQQDVTEHRAAEDNLRVLGRALDACLNAVLVTRPSNSGNLIEYANPAFERITGYSREQWSGRDCAFLQQEDRDQEGLRQVSEALRKQQTVETVVRNYRANGAMFLNLFISPVLNDDGVLTHHIAVINDVTETERNRKNLEYQARYDVLTALPNRTQFLEKLNLQIAESAQSKRPLLIGFVDMDDFKEVNDAAGHGVGDSILKEVAFRLKAALPDEGLLCRYGGDEFAFFVGFDGANRSANEIAHQLTAVFREPLRTDGQSFELNCSVGLSVYPKDGTQAYMLIRRADAAMYHGKQDSADGIGTFNPRIAAQIEHR